jgi:hypothetical protein
MPTLETRQPGPQVVQDLMDRIPSDFPELPKEVFDRFPQLTEWQEATDDWWTRTYNALQNNQRTVSQQDTKQTKAADSLRVSIKEEKVERETADGFLEGKYTLTVTAGDVVTGMEITSSTGPNAGTVSEVAFQADKFQIYSGTTKKVMFVADAVQDKVRIAGVFTVDGASSSIYIKTTAGAGSYNNSGTPFFVDANGRMSLKDKLTWDGSTLSVSGSITATTGTIGGWDINATTISKNNAVLDSSGNIALGTGNDIVILSATDATYRIWIGNVAAGSAAFTVTKAGVLSATGATISGTITASSGTIGGFTLGASSLTSGSGNTYVEIQNSGSPFIKFGNGSHYVAVYSQTGLAVTGSAGIGTLGCFLGTSGGNNLFFVYDNSSTAALSFSGTTGNLTVVGIVQASSFLGSGASLTSLDASNISSGTLDNARLSFTQIPTGDVPINGYTLVGGLKLATVS